jgi:hypothetical protein
MGLCASAAEAHAYDADAPAGRDPQRKVQHAQQGRSPTHAQSAPPRGTDKPQPLHARTPSLGRLAALADEATRFGEDEVGRGELLRRVHREWARFLELPGPALRTWIHDEAEAAFRSSPRRAGSVSPARGHERLRSNPDALRRDCSAAESLGATARHAESDVRVVAARRGDHSPMASPEAVQLQEEKLAPPAVAEPQSDEAPQRKPFDFEASLAHVEGELRDKHGWSPDEAGDIVAKIRRQYEAMDANLDGAVTMEELRVFFWQFRPNAEVDGLSDKVQRECGRRARASLCSGSSAL